MGEQSDGRSSNGYGRAKATTVLRTNMRGPQGHFLHRGSRRETPGLSFGAPEKKLGWHTQPTAHGDVRGIAGCRRRTLSGRKARDFRIAMAGLDGGRLNIAACSIGGRAVSASTATLAYMRERKQFGLAPGRLPGAPPSGSRITPRSWRRRA